MYLPYALTFLSAKWERKSLLFSLWYFGNEMRDNGKAKEIPKEHHTNFENYEPLLNENIFVIIQEIEKHKFKKVLKITYNFTILIQRLFFLFSQISQCYPQIIINNMPTIL